MEKKYGGGKLDKNVAWGLAWLLNWVGALITFILDKDTLTVEEKRELVTIIETPIVVCLLFWTIIVPVAMAVLCILNAIFAFMGKNTIKIPGLYHIAAAIIK